MNRIQKTIILWSVIGFIGMFTCPPWNVYSRERETPWSDSLDETTWGSYNDWDYWESESLSVTGATPVYEFYSSADMARMGKVESEIRREVRENEAAPYKFKQVQTKWLIDKGRLAAQGVLIVILGGGLYITFRAKKRKKSTKQKMLKSAELSVSGV